MAEEKTRLGRTRWRVLHYAAVVSILISVWIAISQRDTFLFLGILVIAPMLLVLSLLLIIQLVSADGGERRLHWRSSLATLLIVWAVPILLFLHEQRHPFELRENVRWMVWSNRYKREVLAQPASDKMSFKHLDWDGSGFAGTDTTLFLVFDPQDTLSIAAQGQPPIKASGIPCDVLEIRRLESHWYAVLFYTGQHWGEQGSCE